MGMSSMPLITYICDMRVKLKNLPPQRTEELRSKYIVFFFPYGPILQRAHTKKGRVITAQL